MPGERSAPQVASWREHSATNGLADGAYDGYGGVESLAKPAQLELIDKAFEASGFYRQVTGALSYGGSKSLFIASSKDTLGWLSSELKHLFYDDCSSSRASSTW